MRIERITAHHFGPFHGQSLDLAPGMSVVVGPNEAGKSSWHAALRLALTGLRRGKGPPSREERQLIERHRPWDLPDQWAVEARLQLADGRQIEISQDLGAKVACRAMDIGLGRDVSDEIINDGAPDAARWLGLDRDAFAATAVVSQAQILAVTNPETAEMLQEHLQRAAATRGTDATAAEAIERLAEFRRTAVGLDRANARGPLRLASTRLAEAERDLDIARARHAEYLERRGAVEAANEAVDRARRHLQVVEAAVARSSADGLGIRARRARELLARHPARPRPIDTQVEDARRVTRALDAWRRRPAPVDLSGLSGDDLEQQIAALPAMPTGDLRPHPSVTAVLRELDRAEEGMRLTTDDARVAAVQRSPRALLAGSVAIGLALSIGSWLANQTLLAVALLAVAAAAAVGLVAARRTPYTALESGSRRADEAAERLRATEGALVDALTERGVAPGPDPRRAAADYEAACAERAAQASEAARGEPLLAAMASRRAVERSAAESERSRAAAVAELRATAGALLGQGAEQDPDQLAVALEAWQQRLDDALRRNAEAIAEWQELVGILDGGEMAELERRAADARAEADRLQREIGPAWPGDPLPSDDPATALAVFREGLEAAVREAAARHGGVDQLEATLPGVAEAEEAVEAARAELGRVVALSEILDDAIRLLRGAEERVHRDLAPVLKEGVTRYLPAVSGGSYLEASVDPRDLSVRVKEAATGAWRQASLLSEGTREQIYLLLRAAMAEHLVADGERAPLLLDEVTVQSDDARRHELLGVLHELSRDRQVILFTHDERVAAWAEANLQAPRDALLRLPLPGSREEAGRSVAVA